MGGWETGAPPPLLAAELVKGMGVGMVGRGPAPWAARAASKMGVEEGMAGGCGKSMVGMGSGGGLLEVLVAEVASMEGSGVEGLMGEVKGVAPTPLGDAVVLGTFFAPFLACSRNPGEKVGMVGGGARGGSTGGGKAKGGTRGGPTVGGAENRGWAICGAPGNTPGLVGGCCNPPPPRLAMPAEDRVGDTGLDEEAPGAGEVVVVVVEALCSLGTFAAPPFPPVERPRLKDGPAPGGAGRGFEARGLVDSLENAVGRSGGGSINDFKIWLGSPLWSSGSYQRFPAMSWSALM